MYTHICMYVCICIYICIHITYKTYTYVLTLQPSC